jgi:hypothetical protein
MATRTISNTGGNYNATGTWVEGVVPTSADDVVATATSGQLTINVASAALTVNLTNYTNTLTITAATWTISGTVFNIPSAMTIVGNATTGVIALTGATTITTNGKVIPYLSMGGTKTLVGTLDCGRFNATADVNVVTTSATATMNITGDVSMSFRSFAGSSSNFRFVINITGSSQTIGLNIGGNATLNLSSSGTLTAIAGGGVQATTSTSEINYISGALSSAFAIFTTGGIFDISGVIIPNFFFRNSGSSYQITLNSDIRCVEANFINDQQTLSNMTFTGVGKLDAQRSRMSPYTLNLTGVIRQYGLSVVLTPGVTHSFGALSLTARTETSLFTVNPSIRISSATPGTKAQMSVGLTQSIFGGNFTDIEVVGQPLYTIAGTTSNTTNINIVDRYYYTAGGGGGVAGGSFTFVN